MRAALQSLHESIHLVPEKSKRRFSLMYGPLADSGSRKASAPLIVESAVETMLRVPLTGAYDEDLVDKHTKEKYSYVRACAFVTLTEEWSIPKLRKALEKHEYVPAGTIETVAYLKLLRGLGVTMGTVLHLGTHIVNEECKEHLLLIHDNGKVEALDRYSTTMVRPYWHIVVAEKVSPTPGVLPPIPLDEYIELVRRK